MSSPPAVLDLARIDYTDHAEVDVPEAAAIDAVGWARAVFEGAPRPMRVFLRVGWAGLLLQLKRSGPLRPVLGWPVASSAPETAVLAARSGLGLEVRLVIVRGTDRVSFSTFIRYVNRSGATAWPLVAPLHRVIVRGRLRAAARRFSGRQAG